MPFPSSQVLATQTAKQLTHALINPKPAGPLCQVCDEQMLALTQLAAFLDSALPTQNRPQHPPHGKRRQ
jgi:hypothetical protein